MSTYRIQATSVEAPQFSGSFIGDGSGLTGIGGSTPTGSLLTTASFTTPNLTFTKGDSTTFNVNISTLTGSLVQSSQTSSMSVLSSSYALTSSYAANGGVTQIIAGTNVTISPTNGLGAVTINSSGGSSGAGANVTASFTNQSTWTFTHALNNRAVVVQTYDTSWNQTVPQNITLTDANTATITFPTNESGYAIATLGGTTSIVNASSSISSSFAATAASVTNLNQTLTVGNITSTPSTEATLNIYPPMVSGNGEGGQILLAASGGLYTSASMLDTYQNQFRLLKGTNTGGSTVAYIITDLQTGGTQFAGAVTASAYSGLPNSWLHALRSGNQTIGSGTWASRDIIFNDVSSINFTYNSSTGIATLKAGKTYRITARVAWAAAGLYVLQHRVYNQTTSGFTGPTAEMVQAPNGTYNISDGTLEHIFNVGASDVDISIRTTSATNALTGEYIRGDLNTQLIIQQIA